MMREILFRGKRVDNGEWVGGDISQLHDGRKYIVNNVHGACIDDEGNFINTEAPFVCSVVPETIGQYTGLKDKNGKRIFEGDIVKAADTNDAYLVGEVVFNACAWLVSGTNWLDSLFRANEVHILEVIGNFHDNPELLEVEG